MPSDVLVAVITGSMAVIGNIIVAGFQFSKTRYQVEQLEKKVEKHNNLIKRMYECEARLNLHDEKFKVSEHRIADLENQGTSRE